MHRSLQSLWWSTFPTETRWTYHRSVWDLRELFLFLWNRVRTILLLTGGLPGRPGLPASCMSFLSNVARVCQLRKHRAICGCWKRSLWPFSWAQRQPFVPRHVSHTFRAQISKGFMKRCFMFAHCKVFVGSGNMGKHCWRKKVIPPSSCTHYEVRNRNYRLGGPGAWTGGCFPWMIHSSHTAKPFFLSLHYNTKDINR